MARCLVRRRATTPVVLVLVVVPGLVTVPGHSAAGRSDCPRQHIVLIGHRGTGPGTRSIDGRSYSEDTVPAFRKAVREGADGYETDYWPAADGVIVGHHDRTLDRMTNGVGAIPRRRWSYIAGLRNTSGAPVSTLAGAVAAMGGSHVLRQQEVKGVGHFDRASLRRLVRIDRRHPGGFLLTSSHRSSLRRIHAVAPGAGLGLIAARGRPGLRSLPGWLDFVMLRLRDADRGYVRRAGRLGLRVSVREVNTLRQLHRAVRLGAARAVTDRPERLGRAC